LALLSKPMVITLPVIMILLDYWPLNRFESQKGNLFLWQLKEKLPFFVLSVVFSIITILAQHKTGGRDLQFSLVSRVSNALVSFMIYLEKTFWPHNLAVFYPFSVETSTMQVISAALLIIAITAVSIASIKRFPALFTGWAWFTLTIALVIGIIPIGDFSMADRYHYLPSIGIAVMLAWGMPYFIKNEQIRKTVLLPAGIMVLAVMAFLSWRQCGYWENNSKLLNHALKVTQNNYLAHINLGSVLLTEGKMQEAIYHYNRANQIMPNNIMVYNNRGKAYAGLGWHESALQDFGEAIRLKPDHADSYYNRGVIYHQLGRHQLAAQDFTETIRLQSDNALAYFNRGNAYINLGRHQQAMDDFSKVISLKPDYADAYNNRAFVYLSQKRHQEAIGDYSRAISLKPDYADAYNNRAFVYLNQGDMVSGCRDAKKACELGNCSTLQVAANKGTCH
ncbi:MAG: tetratricopeptide repeat protein, partial [Smithella sp.]